MKEPSSGRDVGGYVLNQSYKIRGRIVGGVFCFCLDDSGGKVATFGKLEGGQLVSGPDAFHVCLQTDTHIVDFMATIYREASLTTRDQPNCHAG